ncbi:serine carboxypeptidase-like 40 [Macadamia integrifolia]|uniref:serine carboxypeptidase-like 40 n=1 Tax=Macadamia integrifolia TaxID=60698 RepID=UPI001C52DCDB|nr:serine carboxypeptidase-like 40 [Macadamia integrifolia]
MKNRGNLVLGVLLYFLVFLGLSCHATQGDVLWRLMWEKATAEPKIGGSKLSVTSERRFLLSEVVKPQAGLKEKDKIDMLPGQPRKVNFNQYGGYVTVDEKIGRALYYYFVEAEGPKDTLPLVLWLNGGPGCSSVGYGAMAEVGPFRVSSDGKTLYQNQYAWNKVANVLFLDSPVGAGFSYTNSSSDEQVNGDERTANDAYVFLVNWLERFPEYKNREFYIAGESYGGHYVPQLAHTIIQHNKEAKQPINLKGIAIGNPMVHEEDDGALGGHFFEFMWSRGFVSEKTIDSIRKGCDFSQPPFRRTKACFRSMYEVIAPLEFVFMDNIYAPLCDHHLTAKPMYTSLDSFDPCNDIYVTAYMNRPEVQNALHANVTKINYPWEECRSLNWTDGAFSVLPLFTEFLENEIRVLVYSGDIDAKIPMTFTQTSLKRLNLSEATPWYAWDSNSEIGGFSVVYEGGLTYATVKGAGHEVPSYQPKRAFVLIKSFLDGVPLPRLHIKEYSDPEV